MYRPLWADLVGNAEDRISRVVAHIVPTEKHAGDANYNCIIWNGSALTHVNLASFLCDIGKQYSPRCDAAEHGIPSGAILFA